MENIDSNIQQVESNHFQLGQQNGLSKSVISNDHGINNCPSDWTLDKNGNKCLKVFF